MQSTFYPAMHGLVLSDVGTMPLMERSMAAFERGYEPQSIGKSMTEVKPYFKYWGKADRSDPDRYHRLVYHCLDVAAVGMTMLEFHELLRHRFSSATGLDEKSVVQLCTFFMAIHDIGKFSEVFQNNRIDLRKRLYGVDDGRQSSMRHDNLGYVVWKDLWDRLVCDSVFGFNADHPSEFELEDSFNRLAC